MAAKKKGKDYQRRVDQTLYWRAAVRELTKSMDLVPHFRVDTNDKGKMPLEKGLKPHVEIYSADGLVDMTIDYIPSRKKLEVFYERAIDTDWIENNADKELYEAFATVIETFALNIGAVVGRRGTREKLSDEPNYETWTFRASISSQKKLESFSKLLRTTDDLVKLYLKK